MTVATLLTGPVGNLLGFLCPTRNTRPELERTHKSDEREIETKVYFGEQRIQEDGSTRGKGNDVQKCISKLYMERVPVTGCGVKLTLVSDLATTW